MQRFCYPLIFGGSMMTSSASPRLFKGKGKGISPCHCSLAGFLYFFLPAIGIGMVESVSIRVHFDSCLVVQGSVV